MKSISIVTPCSNEEATVEELYNRVRSVTLNIGRYRYQYIGFYKLFNTRKNRSVLNAPARIPCKSLAICIWICELLYHAAELVPASNRGGYEK
jgi:hypothetical protein